MEINKTYVPVLCSGSKQCCQKQNPLIHTLPLGHSTPLTQCFGSISKGIPWLLILPIAWFGKLTELEIIKWNRIFHNSRNANVPILAVEIIFQHMLNFFVWQIILLIVFGTNFVSTFSTISINFHLFLRFNSFK